MDWLEFVIGIAFASWLADRRHKKALDRLAYLQSKYKDYPASSPSAVERGTKSLLTRIFSPEIARQQQFEKAKAKKEAAERQKEEIARLKFERSRQRAAKVTAIREQARRAVQSFMVVCTILFVGLLVLYVLTSGAGHRHR